MRPNNKKLPNSLSSSSSRSRSRAHWGQPPTTILRAKTAGWLTSFIFLHLFPNRTQLLVNNIPKEPETGLQAKPFWSWSWKLRFWELSLFNRSPGRGDSRPSPRPGQNLVDIPAWSPPLSLCFGSWKSPPQIKKFLSFKLSSRCIYIHCLASAYIPGHPE